MQPGSARPQATLPATLAGRWCPLSGRFDGGAWELNRPLQVLVVEACGADARLPPVWSACHVEPANVILTAMKRAGDGDGDTDQADLGILLADWGCTGGDCPGDCDGDGDTDHADLGILLAHWGEGCP